MQKNIYNMLKDIEGPDSIDLLIIENVGNLVCPASFDLGEDMKLLVISTPEGDEQAGKISDNSRCSRLPNNKQNRFIALR